MKTKSFLKTRCIIFIGFFCLLVLIHSGYFFVTHSQIKPLQQPEVKNYSRLPEDENIRLKPTDNFFPTKEIEDETKQLMKLCEKAEENYKNQQFEECIKIFSHAYEVAQKKHLTTHIPFNTKIGAAYVNLAERHNSFDIAEKAENHFLAAIKENPDDSLAYFDIARAYIVMSDVTGDTKYFEYAKKYLNKAKEIVTKTDPEDKLNILTMIYQMMERYPKLKTSEKKESGLKHF